MHKNGWGTSGVLDLNETYWHDNYFSHKKDVAALAKSKTHTMPHLAVVGHLPHPDITASDWGGKRMEFMNTMRSCVDQSTSAIMFGLVGSYIAQDRIRDNTQEAYLLENFGDLPHNKGSNYSACFEDPVCANAFVKTNHPMDTWAKDDRFICGETRPYATSDRECVVDKLFMGMNPTGRNAGYTAIGLTQNLDDSLELFQCAFPSFFAGASPKHSNVNAGREEHWALKKALATRCEEADALYSVAKVRFFEVLAHIRSPHGKSCCRKPAGGKLAGEQRWKGKEHKEGTSRPQNLRH